MIWLISLALAIALLVFVWGVHCGDKFWRDFYLDEQRKRRVAEEKLKAQGVLLAHLHSVSIDRDLLLEANQALAFEVVRLRNLNKSPIPEQVRRRMPALMEASQ